MKYKNILKHWDELIEKQRGDWHFPSKEVEVANLVVWAAVSDTAGSYEVNEEWIGVTKDGKLMWAYASGCSCWDGDYTTKPIKDIKVFEFSHEVPPSEWLLALDTFDKRLSDGVDPKPISL